MQFWNRTPPPSCHLGSGCSFFIYCTTKEKSISLNRMKWAVHLSIAADSSVVFLRAEHAVIRHLGFVPIVNARSPGSWERESEVTGQCCKSFESTVLSLLTSTEKMSLCLLHSYNWWADVTATLQQHNSYTRILHSLHHMLCLQCLQFYLMHNVQYYAVQLYI